MALSLKIADLYADVEIRTAKLDSQLATLQAKLGKVKLSAGASGGAGDPSGQLFPIAKLQAAGLKYQDEIQKQADKAAKAVKAAQDKMAKAAASSASKGATSAMGGPIPGTNGQFIPLAGMQVAGTKYAAAIQDAADKAAAATKAAQEKIDRANDAAKARSAAKNAAWQAREVARIRSEAQVRAKAAQQNSGTQAASTHGPSLSLMSDTDIDDQFTRSQLKTESGRRGLKGMNLAAIGGTLDDLQYVPEMGLRPILNNIMAIAPAAGIALLAFDQLRKHWMDLQSLWGGNATKTQVEQMEELRDATARTAAETAKLAKFDRERAAGKEHAETATDAESSQTQAVKEAFVNAPLENVNKAIKSMFMDDIAAGADVKKVQEMTNLGKTIGELKADQLADPEGFSPARQQALSGSIAAREKIEKELQVYIDDWVEKFRGKVATDPQMLKSFTDKLEASGGNPELVKKLREAQKSPEMKKEEEEARESDEAMERFEQEWRANLDEDLKRRGMAGPGSTKDNKAFGAVQGALSRFGITMDRTAVDPDDLGKGKTIDFGMRDPNLLGGLGRVAGGLLTGNLMGAVGGVNQLAGGKLNDAMFASLRPHEAPEMRFGGSGADFASKIQADILDRKKDDSLLKINGTQVERLTEVRDLLKGAAKNIGGVLLGPA